MISKMSHPATTKKLMEEFVLHLADASRQGHSKLMARTFDSDVVVIGISMFEHLGLQELWIDFGTGKAHQLIPVHVIIQNLGPEKVRALLLFHSYTGCDTTSSFFGIGKKTAWATWEAFPDLTERLTTLLKSPEEVTLGSIHMERLEKFTVMIYSKNTDASRVNEARRQLFYQGTRTLVESSSRTPGTTTLKCRATQGRTRGGGGAKGALPPPSTQTYTGRPKLKP